MITRPQVLLLGGGGHARVLIDALRCSGESIAGIVEHDPGRKGVEVDGVPILGDNTVLKQFSRTSVILVNAVGSVQPSPARRELYEDLVASGFRFFTVVHPSAVIAAHVRLGEGAQIMAGAIVQTGAEIGRNAIVNTGARVDHECVVGDHVHLAPGVVLSGGVRVGAGAHVGTAACAIQGVAIGANAFVAAGAVVTRDVPSGARVGGVPAKPFGR